MEDKSCPLTAITSATTPCNIIRLVRILVH